MSLSEEIISKMANLSKIEIDDTEKEQMQEELGAVIKYMDLLCALDTQDMLEFSHFDGICNVVRTDEVLPSFNRELILSCAPYHDEENYIVPHTID